MTAPGRQTAPAEQAATITGMFAGSELRAGELVAARFRVEELLGIGGMGVVYRAHDEQLGVPVALKLLRPELAARPDAFARFRQEILLARQVSSPHVVRIHDLVQHEGRWLISMDYVPGAALDRLLDAGTALPLEQALKIARQVAEGLAAAHKSNVVHRDLKPANILVTADNDAFISDFGVARSTGVSGMTGSGVIVGTPEYLSPEQARAEDVDARSDLYSLGLILYEMLAGKLPFPAGTPAEMLAQRVMRNPPLLSRVRPDLPAWVVRLVARLLQLRPSRRLQHASDVVRAIDTRSVTGPSPELRPLLVAAAAALALGALAWLALRPDPVATSAQPAASIAAPASTAPIAPLPLAAAAEDLALAAALDDLLAGALAANGRSVDRARMQRALRQLGFDADGARRNAARVAGLLGATQVLGGRIVREGERYRVRLSLAPAARPDDARTVESGLVTIDALPVALQRLVAELGLGDVELGWPTVPAALEAFAQAQLALRERRIDDALAALARANQSDPRFARAWGQRLELLERRGEGLATAVAAPAGEALRRARGRESDVVRGWSALLLGDAAAAAERLAPLARARAADGATRLLHARALEASGDAAAARAELERLVADDPQNAPAWFALGRAAVRAGDAQRGVDEFLVRAQVLYNRLGDTNGQADVLNALGVGYERLGNLDSAIEHFERAAGQRERLGDARGAARSLRNLANARAVKGEFDAAVAALEHARALLVPTGDVGALADVLNNTGIVAEERGDYRAALAAYREALAQRETLGDPAAVAESQLNVAFAYFQVGEFDNAHAYSRQALDRYTSSEDATGIVRAQQGLGLLESARGEWREARRLLQASLATAEAQQMLEEQAVSLAYIADLERLEGRVGDALTAAARARTQFEQRDDARGVSEMQLLEANTWADAGELDRADAALAPLLASAPASREQQAQLALRRADVALLRGDARAALAHAESARALAAGAHSAALAAAAALYSARSLGALERAREAREQLASARTALATFPSVPLRLELALATLETERDVRAYADAQATLAKLPGYVRAAALHRAGAIALRASGAIDAAQSAERAAAQAAERVRATLPPAQPPGAAGP